LNSLLRYGSLLALFCYFAGCDSTPEGQLPTAKVKVTITQGGKPINDAVVTFAQDGEKPPAFGKTDAEGNASLSTYGSLDGAILGSHMVTVAKNEFVTSKGAKPKKEGSVEEGTYDPGVGSTPPPVIKTLLPAKYGMPTTSGLKAEVVKGKLNEFTFDLSVK